MFARFDENPAMTLQDIKKKNVTDGRTHAHTDNVKTVYPPQTKFAGVINMPVYEISNNVLCATSKALDQPAHMRSLIRAFASCLSTL